MAPMHCATRDVTVTGHIKAQKAHIRTDTRTHIKAQTLYLDSLHALCYAACRVLRLCLRCPLCVCQCVCARAPARARAHERERERENALLLFNSKPSADARALKEIAREDASEASWSSAPSASSLPGSSTVLVHSFLPPPRDPSHGPLLLPPHTRQRTWRREGTFA
jgi:hypothetical protein